LPDNGGDLDCTDPGDPKLGRNDVVGEVGEVGEKGEDVPVKGDVVTAVSSDSASGFISIGD